MIGALHDRFESDRPTVEYAALALVLAALAGIRATAQWGVEPLLWWTQSLVGPDVVATAIYSAGVLAVLGIVGVLAERHSENSTGPDRIELARVATAIAGLVVVGTYAVVATVPDVVPASSVLVVGVYSTGTALLAVAYARVRGLSIRTAVPTLRDWRAVAIGVVAVVAAVVALRVAATNLERTSASVVWGQWYLGTPGPLDALEQIVVPAVLGSLGTALLFNGVVQEGLRDRSPAAAVGAVTVLAALFDWAFLPLSAVADGLVSAAALGAGVAAVVLLALGYRRAWTRLSPLGEPVRTVAAAAGGVGCVTAVFVVGVTLAFGSVSPIAVAGVFGYSVAVGVATVTYERVRSVWAPFAVLLAHGLVTDVLAYGITISMQG